MSLFTHSRVVPNPVLFSFFHGTQKEKFCTTSFQLTMLRSVMVNVTLARFLRCLNMHKCEWKGKTDSMGKHASLLTFCKTLKIDPYTNHCSFQLYNTNGNKIPLLLFTQIGADYQLIKIQMHGSLYNTTMP